MDNLAPVRAFFKELITPIVNDAVKQALPEEFLADDDTQGPEDEPVIRERLQEQKENGSCRQEIYREKPHLSIDAYPHNVKCK